MSDFAKAVNALRSEGIGVTVENFTNSIQVATITGSDICGGITSKIKSITFDEDEVSIIRELLSSVACGYERETYYHHCCDAREIISKIDEKIQAGGE